MAQTGRDSKQRQSSKKLLILIISSRRLYKHQAKISGQLWICFGEGRPGFQDLLIVAYIIFPTQYLSLSLSFPIKQINISSSHVGLMLT